MPNKSPGITLKLDLLKPQGVPEKIYVRVTKWLLSTGRYIIVFVELLVLIAFISRFKFDADLESTKEAIDQQIPFIESQQADEILIRKTQQQLSVIKDFRLNSADFPTILKKIADQTPSGITITNINLERSTGTINIKIAGKAKSNNDVNIFILGLTDDHNFNSVNLSSVELEQRVLSFTITATSPVKASGNISL